MCAIAWQQALPLVQVETDGASKQHGGIARLQRLSAADRRCNFLQTFKCVRGGTCLLLPRRDANFISKLPGYLSTCR